MNLVVLIGRLTADPELKQSSNNNHYVRFNVAVNRQYKTKTGETETDFIPCVAWNSQADFIAKYLAKGNLVSVEGNLRQSKYTNKNNEIVYDYNVNVNQISPLEPKSKRNNSSNFSGPSTTNFSAVNRTSTFTLENNTNSNDSNIDDDFWSLDD